MGNDDRENMIRIMQTVISAPGFQRNKTSNFAL